MKLYNTLTRKKMEFKPISSEVRIYSCGPTVYGNAHVGNLRAYIVSDTLKRVLQHLSYKVRHVMNVTDVGHLVGDGSLGEDKLKQAARSEHKSAKQVAEEYERLFLIDMKKLNIERPSVIARATAHIPQILVLIDKLDALGYLYKLNTGIYFDTSKFKGYGELAGMSFEQLNDSLIAGARVERPSGTRNITDFAVWRFSPKEEKEMVWESRYGRGFPGWHIECSAISMEYLGNHFDIHTGGVDHIMIHHQNEIAQSESATGEKFVNFWVHNEFLKVNGRKMSKSLHNIYTLEDLGKSGISPEGYKYFVLSGHYRSIMNLTTESLQNAEKTLNGIYNFIERVSAAGTEGRIDKALEKEVNTARDRFFSWMENDMNTPEALSSMHALISAVNRRASSSRLSDKDSALIINAMVEMDSVLGLSFEKHAAIKSIAPAAMKLINEREDARAQKDFKKADRLRNELAESFGIIVEDGKDGPVWRRAT